MDKLKPLKTIALVDPLWGGHHSTYFKLFSKKLLELGHQVLAFCPEPIELNSWIAFNCQEQAARFFAFEIHEPELNLSPISQLKIVHRFGLALATLARWKDAAIAIQNASVKIGNLPDLVFFCWIDSYLNPLLTHYIVDQIFPYSWSGLYFQPRHLRVKQRFSPIRRGFLNPDAVLKSPHCLSVAVLDEGIAEELQNKINGKPVVIFPDITDESLPDSNFLIIHQIREKAGARKIIGLLGSLGKRKGLLTLLEVAQKAAKEDYFFVFAGALAEVTFDSKELVMIQNIVNSSLDNCFFYFEQIPDGPQFNALVNVCDILVAIYEDFPYSSNILTKAAIFKKFVVANNNYCVGERVQRFELGLGVPEKDVSKCIEALHRLCHQTEFKTHDLQPNFEGYERLHAIEQLEIAFQTILDTI